MDANIQSILAKMTLEEKISLCNGADFWHSKAMEQYARTHFDPTMLTHRMMHLYRRLTENC